MLFDSDRLIIYGIDIAFVTNPQQHIRNERNTNKKVY